MSIHQRGGKAIAIWITYPLTEGEFETLLDTLETQQ
jgi:hypothetical protein